MKQPRTHRPWPQVLWYGAALLTLALVFMAYLQPELMVDLANRVWSCF